MLDGDSFILLDVMKLALLHDLFYHDSPLIRLIIVWVLLLYVHFLVLLLVLYQINLRQLCISLANIIRIYHDARSFECQI